MICFVSGPVFACAARVVNQQPPVIDGVTGAWGKGVSGPLSVWWSFPPSPPSRFYFVYSLRGVWTELSANKLTKDITSIRKMTPHSLKIASEPGLLSPLSDFGLFPTSSLWCDFAFVGWTFPFNAKRCAVIWAKHHSEMSLFIYLFIYLTISSISPYCS